MRKRPILVTLLFLCFAAGVSAQTKSALKNQDILEMKNAGFEESTIIKAIDSSECAFDTSVQALVLLKQAGISEGLISAMLVAGKPKAVTPPEVAKDQLPSEIGIYAKQGKEWIELNAEIVNWQSGGVGKRVATLGMTRGHIKGRITGPKSKRHLVLPLEIIIITYEGVSGQEYQLVKMDEKDDRREFRQWTGGVLHASSGSHQNAIEFEPEKVKSRTYKALFDKLTVGEYGFLPPIGPVSPSANASGRAYTFGIIE